MALTPSDLARVPHMSIDMAGLIVRWDWCVGSHAQSWRNTHVNSVCSASATVIGGGGGVLTCHTHCARNDGWVGPPPLAVFHGCGDGGDGDSGGGGAVLHSDNKHILMKKCNEKKNTMKQRGGCTTSCCSFICTHIGCTWCCLRPTHLVLLVHLKWRQWLLWWLWPS